MWQLGLIIKMFKISTPYPITFVRWLGFWQCVDLPLNELLRPKRTFVLHRAFPAVIDTHVHILFKIVLLRILEGFVWSLVPKGVPFQSIMHT